MQYLKECGYLNDHALVDLATWDKSYAFFNSLRSVRLTRYARRDYERKLLTVRQRAERHQEVLLEWRGTVPLDSMDVMSCYTGALYGKYTDFVTPLGIQHIDPMQSCDVAASLQVDGDWWTGMLHEFYSGYAGCTVYSSHYTKQANDVARQILLLHGRYSTVDKLEQFRSFASRHLQGGALTERTQWEKPERRGDSSRGLMRLFLLHNDWGPLQDRSVEGQLKRFLLVLGIRRVDEADMHGWYPLHRALAFAHKCAHLRQVVWLLLELSPSWVLHTSTPREGDGAHDYTPMHFVCSQQICHDPGYTQVQLALALVRKRANLNVRGGDKRKDPLQLAQDCNPDLWLLLKNPSRRRIKCREKGQKGRQCRSCL